ncbi:Maf family protein [Candidatus Liberibacter sp.]|uniref:Maf family protein n=1 Tax=Candidatus Liberibacter sp. TaxID=34022 RepID=UPI0015F524AA|nr:Maf family protein [Candidatus Liberibacter sp.]MBA5723970.1 Maf family protein [Candidatus Liberibacter sp.]
MSKSLILASSSSSRRKILKNAGIQFIGVNPKIDEREVEKSFSISDRSNSEKIALMLAEKKALEVGNRYPDSFVIGCDQSMSLGNSIYHKPKDMFEAEQHLLLLSGKTHRLGSAYVLTRNNIVLRRHVSVAQLTMHNFSRDFIKCYLKKVSKNALLSIGSYQIDKEGIQLFKSIRGDYFTIVGLPLIELLNDLKRERIIN